MASKKKKTVASAAQATHSRKREYQAMAVIAVLSLAVFGRNVTFTYILVDLPKMIFENPHIITGVTWENVVWAFTQPNLALYQPLPNLTFMLESHFFGGWPGGYHTVTLLWHIVCMCLFLWVMMRLIGNFPAVFAATLLMAVHPYQVGVVSQIATRNEIMQAFFMLLSIEAYRRYVLNRSYPAYALAVFFMGMGLLCKQIIVMLPVALLLLDYWPFHRIEISFRSPGKTLRDAGRLIAEKAGFWALSFMGVFLAFYGKMQYDQIRYHVARLTIPDAFYFVITGYARYVGHLLYPVRVSYFEIYGEEQLLWFFILCTVVLAVISAIAFVQLWKRPYLMVGWLWFIFLMLPVSGVVRYMLESIALRYLYAPAMGLFLAVFLVLHEFARSKSPDEDAEAPAPTSEGKPVVQQWYWITVWSLAAILSVLAFWQNGFVRDTETGVMRMQKVTGDRSAVGHNTLAVIRLQQGRLEEAEEHFRRSVEIMPDNAVFRYYYSGALYQIGKYQQVLETMKPAIEEVPDEPEYLSLYGMALTATGRYRDAEAFFSRSLAIEPNDTPTLHNMAYCLMLQARFGDAEAYIQKILDLDPGNQGVQALIQILEQQTGREFSGKASAAPAP